ncbi:MAG: ABC1 kinase family protein [Acidimicrobiia bacterium]
MKRKKATAVTAAAATVVTTGAATVAARGVLNDPRKRQRIERTARIWRLSLRRGAHFALVKVRGTRLDDEARARLEEQFAIRTAEDVARELGQMKGAMMKAGQLLGFIIEGLPKPAQEALASLQADVPPMAPSLAEGVIERELGAHPSKLFLDWKPVPEAAASVGQVHKAVLHDGRVVAVKVQYPGVDTAIETDLSNAEFFYALFSAVALPGLDVRGLVDELRLRMRDELDYTLEAANQQEFADTYRDHPFFRVPIVIPEYSSKRVLTSEWVDGMNWAQFEATASDDAKQRAAEVLFRFAQGSIHQHGMFNGDPHPGNYRFHADGSVTFLDFGLVKRWSAGEWERLAPCLDAVLANDPVAVTRAMEDVGFLPSDHGADPDQVFAYVSAPYQPFLVDRFTFTREFTGAAIAKLLDVNGPNAAVIKKLNMPSSFVILDRVVWGISALLGKLNATGPWRSILFEYRQGAPPATELGRLDAAWRATHPSSPHPSSPHA